MGVAMKRTVLFLLLACACSTHAAGYRFARMFGEQGTIVQSNRFNAMDGIAVDRFGHVFVADWFLYTDVMAPSYGWVAVKRFSTEGTFERFWRSAEYGEPAGIDCACNGDPFYCVGLDEGWGRRIDHSTPDGVLLHAFPADVWHGGQEYRFRDVAASADGDIFGVVYLETAGTATPWLKQVVKFRWDSSNWVDIIRVTVSNEQGRSDAPWGIDVDPWRRRVYVTLLASNGTAAVKLYDMELQSVGAWSPWGYAAQPYGVAVDNRDGSVLVCEGVSNMIYKYDRNGHQLCAWGGPGAGPGQFSRPSDLDVDMRGWVYVADAGNHRVQVFAPPREGNLNFIVNKSKIKVNWKTKAQGKDRDVVVAKGIAAVDVYTNLFGLPAQPLAGMPGSFYFNDLPIVSEMLPTKTNPKGTKALYSPDKDHKLKLIYRPKGALILVKAKLKRGNIDVPLGITDTSPLPPWLWVTARMTLSNDYVGVHYMRAEHANKSGKQYKATKK